MFLDASIKEIFNDMRSSEYVVSSTLAAYAQYIRFNQLFLKHYHLLPLLERLSRTFVAERPCVCSIYWSYIFSSKNYEVAAMIRSTY